MRCGVYGKLPAKRDFIAIASPRDFLSAWEPWLQGSVSSSRAALGAEWQAAFLRAPIWRFWLGSTICGTDLVGALMPSVDGVGRYFPLCVFAKADAGEAIAPPEIADHAEWLEPAEELLLSTLTEEFRFESLGERLDGLPTLQGDGGGSGASAEAGRSHDGTLVGAIGPDGIGATFGALRLRGHGSVYAGMSYWWTLGGEDFAPTALASRGLPAPDLFSGMLTGRFDPPT